MNESTQIKLELKSESFYTIEKGKKKVALSPQGETQYIRNDMMGLMSILDKFDTRKHTVKDYKHFISVKDKLLQCYYSSAKELALSVDEAGFLKNYLSTVTQEDAKDVKLSEFEMRTLIGLLEQFE